MSKIYVPAPGRTVPLPGGQSWPATGRAINPASSFEQRLVRDGDIIEKKATANSATPKTPKETD